MPHLTVTAARNIAQSIAGFYYNAIATHLSVTHEYAHHARNILTNGCDHHAGVKYAGFCANRLRVLHDNVLSGVAA